MKRLLISLLLSSYAIAACSPTKDSNVAGTYQASSTTATVVLTGLSVGDLAVVFAWCTNAGCNGNVTSVQDSGGNAYTLQAGGWGATNSGSGFAAIYYRLASPVSGSVTVTITHSAAVEQQLGGMAFALGAGCTATFDKDATAAETGSTLTQPTISPTSNGSLLYAATAISNSTSGPTWGSWSSGNNYATTGNLDGYVLSSSGSKTVDFSLGAANNIRTQVIAFALSTGGGGGNTCRNALTLLGVGCSK